VIGLVGEDPFGQTIDTMLRGVEVQKRSLVLKRISNPKNEKLHILFISASEKGKLSNILAPLEGKPILTISDISHFIERGGMIGFEMDDNKVHFSINKGVADAAHLQFSSQVLKLANTVKETPDPRGD